LVPAGLILLFGASVLQAFVVYLICGLVAVIFDKRMEATWGGIVPLAKRSRSRHNKDGD
jgi:hypothetical protein